MKDQVEELDVYGKMIMKAESSRNWARAAMVYNDLGNSLQDKCQFSKAVMSYNRAVFIARKAAAGTKGKQGE